MRRPLRLWEQPRSKGSNGRFVGRAGGKAGGRGENGDGRGRGPKWGEYPGENGDEERGEAALRVPECDLPKVHTWPGSLEDHGGCCDNVRVQEKEQRGELLLCVISNSKSTAVHSLTQEGVFTQESGVCSFSFYYDYCVMHTKMTPQIRRKPEPGCSADITHVESKKLSFTLNKAGKPNGLHIDSKQKRDMKRKRTNGMISEMRLNIWSLPSSVPGQSYLY